MDITQIDEQWITLTKTCTRPERIVAISNTGKYLRANGSVGILSLRSRAKYCGKRERCSRIIAENFLITVRRSDQIYVDHITHYPIDYNVNNVLNLRWCTPKENVNFEEAKNNRSGENHPMYGRTGDKSTRWKGDYVGPQGAYKRARKRYKAGEITEEEFQHYRDAWVKHKRDNRC